MDDPTTKSVKLIPCHTLTAAIKDIFHIMYDRRPRGIHVENNVLIYQLHSISRKHFNRHKSDQYHICVYETCLLSHCLTGSVCLLKNEKEAL